MTPDIRPLVAGNWKMNGTRENLAEIKAIAEGLGPELADAIDALICPPATLLYVATAVADETPLSIGAQDCHTTVRRLHRRHFRPNDRRLHGGLCAGGPFRAPHPAWRKQRDRARQGRSCEGCRAVRVICIGETEAERKAGETLAVLETAARRFCARQRHRGRHRHCL
jgi:triosephosphate isomerase